MKKLLVLVLLAPCCLFASHKHNEVNPDNLDHVALKAVKQRRVNFTPFWRDVESCDLALAEHKLLRMKPLKFDDFMYVQLCHFYLAAIRGETDRALEISGVIQHSISHVYPDK